MYFPSLDSSWLDTTDGGERDEAASPPGAGTTDGLPEQDQDTGREPTHPGEETTRGESVATEGTARTEGWCNVLFFSFSSGFSHHVGLTADLPTPHRTVRLLSRSQSSTFYVSLTPSLPFSCYMLFISPHHIVSRWSFWSLRHSRYSSDVFVPDLKSRIATSCHRELSLYSLAWLRVNTGMAAPI